MFVDFGIGTGRIGVWWMPLLSVFPEGSEVTKAAWLIILVRSIELSNFSDGHGLIARFECI